MNVIKCCMGLFAIVLFMAVVGEMDYNDVVEQDAYYCEQVRNGVWQDYKNNFDVECKK